MHNMLKHYAQMVEARLEQLLESSDKPWRVLDNAMKYSLLGGGKRLRPCLLLAFCDLYGGDSGAALDFACALEMIHTYSLIHDDLPCMDDDDMRRGKPSCHRAFDESTAVLAGDSLLNLAFETMLSASKSNPKAIAAAAYIANCSGRDGMIGGQVLDLAFEKQKPNQSTLAQMVSLKTGALFRAACVGGAMLATDDSGKIADAEKYAVGLGMAFQIKDDVLDVFGDESKLGKAVNSDKKSEKFTFFTAYGEEKCSSLIDEYTKSALSALEKYEGSTMLCALVQDLSMREH